jgi:hypothetical protein
MPTDVERFVERAFHLLFERAADAGDRARREAARGASSDQAFEDGRALTFYEVMRELWTLARELGLHERGLGAPQWHPDDVGVLRRDDPETQERIRTSLQFMARSDWEAQARFLQEQGDLRGALGDRLAGTWIRWERHRRQWHVAVAAPTPEDVELVTKAARRAGFVPFVLGVRYSASELESFRRAGETVLNRTRASPADDVLRAYGPAVEANAVRVTISEPNARVMTELLDALPADALEFEITDIQAVAL